MGKRPKQAECHTTDNVEPHGDEWASGVGRMLGYEIVGRAIVIDPIEPVTDLHRRPNEPGLFDRPPEEIYRLLDLTYDSINQQGPWPTD